MYTPIKALKFYKSRYGRLFDTLDKIFQGKIPTDDEWDKNLMYVPLAVILKEWYKANLPLTPSNLFIMRSIFVIKGWEVGKTVYEFDETLLEQLREQAKKDTLISEDIMKLPIYCLYLKLSETDGAYITTDVDFNTGEKEIYVIEVKKDKEDGEIPYYFTLPKDLKKIKDVNHCPPESIEKLNFYANIILYLNSTNADIEVKTGSIKRRKSIVREQTQVTVGEKAGEYIRYLKKVHYEKSAGGGHHRTPITHIRNAHYHTFLYGEGKKQRKVKWVAPIIVNGNKVERLTTIKVKE